MTGNNRPSGKSEGPDDAPHHEGLGDEPVAPVTEKAKVAARSTQWLAYMNLGWILVGNLGLGVGAGLWADRHFKTAPILLLIGVFLGFGACGYTIYRAVKKIESDETPKPRN